MHTPVWLAVDLGTTHTVAVVGRQGQEPRSLLFDGSPLLPSGVYLDADGELHTGRDAQRLAAAEPARFEPHPKRRIDEGTVLLGDREIPVEELLATGLRRVADAATASGQQPTETVLTYPADWGPVRRAALERAAATAGLGRVRLLAEPIAAATYCADILGHEIPRGGAVAIFDFGGGTFDVAVVRREDDDTGRFRTLAVGGLDDLGGLDVDMALTAHLGRIVAGRDPELWQRLSEPQTTADLRDRLAFWGEVRAAKEMLSRTSTAPVALPGHNPMGLHLTRDELQSLADPLVSRAVDETRRTVERAGVDPGGLAALLLVGGSSRMPLVATRLHARLGVAPAVPEQPELPVAFGALRFALTDQADPAASSPPATPQAGVPTVTYAPFPQPHSQPQVPSQPPFPQPSPSLPPHAPMTPQAPYQPSVYTGPLPGQRAPKRTRILASVLSAVVLMAVAVVVVLNSVEWGGVLGDNAAGDLLEGLADNIDDATGGGPELTLGYEQQLGADGASAVAAADGLAILAEVVDGQTAVTAVTPAGEPVWSATVDLEPTELFLTVVGDVLLIDATASATDEGQNMRAALALDGGEVLWKRPWIDRNDVAYYGNAAVIEQRTGFEDNAVIRVDLTTGEEVWKETGPYDLFIIDEYRVRAATVWDEGDSPGAVPPNSNALYDHLAATDRIVELLPDEGTGIVRDAADGDTVTSGDLPVNSEYWTVFDDLVIGKANEATSPGRSTLIAHSLGDLGEAWRIELDVAFSIQHVKACGPHLVCAALDHTTADDQYQTIAVDTQTGEQVWKVGVEWSVDDHWYSTSSGLVHGDQVFDTVDSAQILDFEGRQVVEGELFTSAIAVRGDRAAMEVSTMGGWDVVVIDTATGERSAGYDVGADLPEHAAFAGDLLVVLGGDLKARVLTVPELA
ncbi:Hsp70 family protein [Glycomyces niveus]|uniref:Hsp70 family protein n=1 Tax=Glycomyces niveus TaxID=2820287 RepID=A0ABS3U9H1_9ACTN|nr:Hsp70 family protein [Glycomyces sp. NEAU-S30]MBO3735418.1 Hsp70 family protein [Glycomyces sp. NEAU-S30]